MTALLCDPHELKKLFLFDKLTNDQLTWLCAHGRVENRSPGLVVVEGEPAVDFYVLLEGEVASMRRVGGQDVEVSRTEQPGVYSGAFMAYLGDRVPQLYSQTLRVLRPSRFFLLSSEDFAFLMREWFPMATHLLEGLFFGNRNSVNTVAQRERLLALGSLSAGLTHELNNPAAAAVRATSSLRTRVAGMRHKLALIAGGTWDRAAMETLMTLQERAVELVAKAPELSPLEASDAEDEIADWFEGHGIGGGFDLAPTFVQAGIDVPWLDQVTDVVDGDALEGAVRWLNYTLETELLMNEIENATTRISTLVDATRQYSQLDRAPRGQLDLNALVESTLVMLAGKIGGVQVVKEFDRALPLVPGYGAELNQVWTNLIDNALQAMAGSGTLTLTTRRSETDVFVDVADTGSGISDDVVNRIFEPFFTTKPVGQGTGLGLDISWRIVVNKHDGDLTVRSRPGETVFTVRLPLTEPLAKEQAG